MPGREAPRCGALGAGLISTPLARCDRCRLRARSACRRAELSAPAGRMRPTRSAVQASRRSGRGIARRSSAWSDAVPGRALQTLIRPRWSSNYDVRLAAARILEAQAQLGVTRADQFPQRDAPASTPSASGRRLRSDFRRAIVGAVEVQASALRGSSISGASYRRATEVGAGAAAGERVGPARGDDDAGQPGRERLLRPARARSASWIFRSARSTSRRESLQLTQVREQGGGDVAGRRAAGRTAGLRRDRRDRARSNGRSSSRKTSSACCSAPTPGPIARGRPLTDQPHPIGRAGRPAVGAPRTASRHSAGRSSSWSPPTRRSASRARHTFRRSPSPGPAGFESTALAALFTGDECDLDGGGVRRCSRSSPPAGRDRKSRSPRRGGPRRSSPISRRSGEAFREVSDALVGYRKLREFREQQALLREAAQDARRLARDPL